MDGEIQFRICIEIEQQQRGSPHAFLSIHWNSGNSQRVQNSKSNRYDDSGEDNDSDHGEERVY